MCLRDNVDRSDKVNGFNAVSSEAAIRMQLDETARRLTAAVENSEKSLFRISCDVCIITNLSYPGGNASSTLDEVRYFQEQGKSVSLVHCRVKSHQEPHSRFLHLADVIYESKSVISIECTLLVMRSPLVICTANALRHIEHTQCKQAAFIVNNSMFRPGGERIFFLQDIQEAVSMLDCDDKAIYPLGPAIVKELDEAGVDLEFVSSNIWPPTFDPGALPFRPREQCRAPYLIGRHSRDGVEKWLELPVELAAAYPNDGNFNISILGGAARAVDILGHLPSNWRVHEFGDIPPSEFLKALDAFVYFPASGLNEAFGRAIMEAMLCGVPCVLPHRMRETFGELAFYCKPLEVKSVLERLLLHDAPRLAFLRDVREKVETIFGSGSLRARAPSVFPDTKEATPQSMRVSESSLGFRQWVQYGGDLGE